MELGTGMELIFRNFDNTRLKRAIETVLSALFPVRIGTNRAACSRAWWEPYQSHNTLDPYRPFERGDEGVKPAQEGSLETPTQRRSRVFMSLKHRDIERKADAARRQEKERNHRSLDTTPATSQELERGFNRLETDSLRTSLAD